MRYSASKYSLTLKPGIGVVQGHWKWCRSINSVLANPLAACAPVIHLSSTFSQSFEPQVQKIAVFTYRSPHFCSPWGRPLGNHAKCCMDGNIIRCLQIVSQLFELQVQKIAIFTYRSPHFCFPWRRPCDYHAICCMDGKTIQCLPNPSQHVPIYLQ